ncbi:hypothetical protein QVD17_09189 [Tagetes erecta]|uniref:Uncharacterized protein n=1 Tax=Tagetes erecta TaxID=13708 RepID=A0AAD8L139_TARER|nr:hypothetical protein QVD17_09189 [Tagetes erecta]
MAYLIINSFSTSVKDWTHSRGEDAKHSSRDDGWYEDIPRAVKEVNTPHLETKVAELTKVVMQLTKEKGVEKPRACGICLHHGHPTDMCPTLQDDVEQAQAMVGYLGQSSRSYEQP